MFVEIGHFYANEAFYDLSYLKDQRFGEQDFLSIFIDDYTSPVFVLDILELRRNIQNIIGTKVFTIYYESDMVRNFDLAIRILDKNKIERVSINGQDTEIRFDGHKIYDYQTKRPTCQMLSCIWALYRHGCIIYGKPENYESVLTVIDKKYMKLENRVYKMIPAEFRDRFFYRFF